MRERMAWTAESMSLAPWSWRKFSKETSEESRQNRTRGGVSKKVKLLEERWKGGDEQLQQRPTAPPNM